MYHPFSVPDTIKTSWYLVRKNFSLIAIYSLISFFVIIGSSSVIYIFFRDNILSISISCICFLLLLSLFVLGFIKLIFRLIDKEYYDFDLKDIMPNSKMIYGYVILFFIVYTASFFLEHAMEKANDSWIKYLVGIFIGGFLQFFLIFYFPVCACFIVDDGSGPIESISQSFKLIRGNFLKYLLLFAFIEVMVFVGFFTVIGLLFAVPFSYIILVVAYRKLIYSHQDADDDLSETN
ncbi:MAG TPA: hypothetical protein VHS53_03865 [Mucilaginibacter sp.]|nr:hypothetical protein [Mucilaginibacter sp.]